MNILNGYQKKEKQAVTTSLQIAEAFEKQHKHVIESIEKLLEEDVSNFGEMFMNGNEPDSYGRERKIYFINRDGFSFLVMSFTGSKAREFKLKYIEAFNKMEAHIKQELDTSNLSPELQMFNTIFKTVAQQELNSKRIENKVDSISEIVALNTDDWRKDSHSSASMNKKMVQLQEWEENYMSF